MKLRGRAKSAFLRKMAAGRAALKHRRKRQRKKNPAFKVAIKAVPKGGGSPLYYDGKHFSATKTRRKRFASIMPAKIVALNFLKRYPVLRLRYKVSLVTA